MSATGAVVTRKYGSFRGVDFRGDEIHISRSPDSLNVWRDYSGNYGISTRPGMRVVNEVNQYQGSVYGIFFYDNAMLVHKGTNILRIDSNATTAIFDTAREAKSQAFVYDGIWYFKDGTNYLCYDGTTIEEVDGYTPVTSFNRTPEGAGDTYNEVNLLQPKRTNTFMADGKSKTFQLDSTDIDNITPEVTNLYTNEKLKVEGFDKTAGTVTLEDVPNAAENKVDNISITYSKTVKGYAERIKNCTLLQVFDNRVFVGGNPDYPNTVWHCSLDDPTYFSDQDVYEEGLDPSLIRGLVAGNNALWVFTEPNDSNTCVFYHTPTIDSEKGKVYPYQHSSVAVGCIGGAINFNDDIVFFSPTGMEGVSGSITTEQVVAHRSSLVDHKLMKETAYKDMVLAEWRGYLMVFIGNKVYLADSRTAFNNEGHKEYDWYYWELEQNVTCACVHDGELYLGTALGVYKLDDVNAPVESWWTTPKDKFNAPNLVKTTNKRGCVVEGTGDITVYSKTEGTEFTLIGEFNGIKDYFVPRIKEKKFKDIQLKFHSNTRFSLETATLEAFIGGYIKR